MGGAFHFLVLCASVQVPGKLGWLEEFKKLSSLNRKVFWTHGAYIFSIIVFMSMVSSFLVGSRIDGFLLQESSRLARRAPIFDRSRLSGDFILFNGWALYNFGISCTWSDEMNIVFFDGYCSLCSSLVDWLIQADQQGRLKFASLQGETAARMLGQNLKLSDPDTVIYLREGQKYDRSTAILMIASDLGGAWRFALVFLGVPRVMRDFIYKCIAHNRYRFFKKRDTCRRPTAEERARILN